MKPKQEQSVKNSNGIYAKKLQCHNIRLRKKRRYKKRISPEPDVINYIEGKCLIWYGHVESRSYKMDINIFGLERVKRRTVRPGRS